MKQPPPGQKVTVVIVVEPVWSLYVEGGEVGVAAGRRADAAPVGGERRVNVGFVVDAGAEGGALGEADGVGAGEHHHVAGGQALGGERRDKGGEVGGRRRQI